MATAPVRRLVDDLLRGRPVPVGPVPVGWNGRWPRSRSGRRVLDVLAPAVVRSGGRGGIGGAVGLAWRRRRPRPLSPSKGHGVGRRSIRPDLLRWKVLRLEVCSVGGLLRWRQSTTPISVMSSYGRQAL